MAEKIIPPIPCSHCGEPFTPGKHQRHNASRGKRSYCTRSCEDAGKSRPSLLERFLSHVRELPDGCLEWTGYTNKKGYGVMRVGSQMRLAHHAAWFLHHGWWPAKELDHTCHIPEACRLGAACPHRRCVNWQCLKEVDHKNNCGPDRSNLTASNIARGAAIHVCKHGHELTEENTYRYKGHRRCRECNRLHGIKWRAEHPS